MKTIANKRVAIYARSAPSKQAEADRTEEDLAEVRQFVLSLGGLTVAEYFDSATGTSSEARPEYNRMLADAQSGKFEVVAIHSPSRLFRSGMDYIFESARLRSMGIKVVIAEAGQYEKFGEDQPE
jgi:DNA invertase Pin-like site-specific DNA recombinase